jgi:TonB family protein
MFDVVRGRSSAPTRLKPALLVSLLAHAVLVAVAVLLSVPAPTPPRETAVKHWPRARLQGAGGGGPQSTAPTPPKVVGRRPTRTVRTPLEIARPVDLPPRAAPDQDVPVVDGTGMPGANERGGNGEDRACATPPCGGGEGPIEEDVVAQVPVLLSAPDVVLSAEARRNGVEGTMLVRCVITAAGTVESCEILKGLPLADAAVLAALRGRQYRPAQVEGRAVSVRHVFTINVQQTR